MIRWAISFIIDRIIFLTVVYWLLRSLAGSQVQSFDAIEQWVDQVSPFAQIGRALH